tara:strand:- start:554 stop:763 length:210 start_codon:yes stop_codon:yes gene_type:complete
MPAITTIPSNDPNGDPSYSISPSDSKVKLKRFVGDDPLEHDDMDNNFEVMRRKINELVAEVEALKALQG